MSDKKTTKDVAQKLKEFDSQISELNTDIADTEALLAKYKNQLVELKEERKVFHTKYFASEKDIYVTCKVQYTREYCATMHIKKIDYDTQTPLTVMDITRRRDCSDLIHLSTNEFISIYWIEKVD